MGWFSKSLDVIDIDDPKDSSSSYDTKVNKVTKYLHALKTFAEKDSWVKGQSKNIWAQNPKTGFRLLSDGTANLTLLDESEECANLSAFVREEQKKFNAKNRT